MTTSSAPGEPAPQLPACPVDEPPVLPDRTRDETDLGWGGASWRDGEDNDERLLRDRPPHWG